MWFAAAAKGAPAERVEKLKFADSGASGYVTFDDAPVSEGGSGTAVWARLKFQTREREFESALAGSSELVCCVCLDEHEKGAKPAACGHGFHAECLNKWKKVAHEHGHDAKAKCPMCRQEIEM